MYLNNQIKTILLDECLTWEESGAFPSSVVRWLLELFQVCSQAETQDTHSILSQNKNNRLSFQQGRILTFICALLSFFKIILTLSLY